MNPDITERASGQVPERLWNRLHFAWGAFWIVVLTVAFATGYLVTHLLRPTTAHFTWWARAWGRAMMRFMGIRVQVDGTHRLRDDTPYVIVANHQNGLDIPVVADALPIPFGFVAKAELERVPFLGAALRNSPSVFVDKSDPRRTLTSMRRAASEIREGSSVLVFPEGARSYDGRIQSFQKGAFLLAMEAGVPLVPVTIVNAASVFNELRRASRPGVIQVHVGDPILIDGLHRRDIPEVMDRVFDAIAAPLPPEWRNPGSELP